MELGLNIRTLTGVALFGLAWLKLAAGGEDPHPHFQATVDMVVLTFTVTDGRGKYVKGLQASDIEVQDDGVVQKVVDFVEGSQPNSEAHAVAGLADVKVFVLFDTSNWMYTNFPYACDAIAQFVRGLDSADSVAIYKFSRNLFRAVPLTADRQQAISGARSAVAGDDTALFNAVLLTLRDAATRAGRKALVVFSNGPDNASIVSPSDVGRVAQDEGIPIYLISTRDEQRDAISAASFQRITGQTGGRLFWAESWKKQSDALALIRQDLANSYTIAYYPTPSSNSGFRSISVDVTSATRGKYVVHTRSGYNASTNSKVANR
ncbi:MAG TPA: VWA domain-containing protein [Bryobacteraceae bacterium]